MNDSVRLRKELLSLIKELGSPGVLASMTFRHIDSAQHALMKPRKNITVQSGYHTVNPNAAIIPGLRKQLQ
ncbi:unnamed protein product [Sphagnum balticum]